ncbi:hypothetical protein B0H63DRAFT_464286 [Podospora didyma]|uniref:GYF domain-containing protein n=1 Tax=Podospora didyma TaxID=330526 RepID=A0AAE0NYH6_9PEZI|nr:hypothetical protein B0H63DRAFT_464286 [Podospora didyma]
MSSQLPSSFASAAAGQIRDSRGNPRGDQVRGSGSGEWPRANGTRTFRRQSNTPSSNSAFTNSVDASHHANSDLPPLSANPQSASLESGPQRYSKEELLDIYKSNSHANIDPSSLYMPNWNPNQVNGVSSRGWGKGSGDSSHVPQDPTVCWEQNATVLPIGLQDMTAEERRTFDDVNSTLKPPQQGKDGNQAGGGSGQNGRKTSISVGSPANHQSSSPLTASRPGARRRETADTNPFSSSALASPTGTGRFPRDDWLPRRSTDLKDMISDEPEEQQSNRPEPPVRGQSFGLPRINTAPNSAFGAGPSSLWGTSSGSASAGMGAFGSFIHTTAVGGDTKRSGTGGSRLAHLIPKESAESSTKPSEAANADANREWRPRHRTDTDPFGGAGDGGLSGSAILGGARDNSPPPQANLRSGGVFDTPVKGNAGDFGMAGLNLGAQGGANGPTSPSETNPYRSPLVADRGDDGPDDDLHNRHGQPGQSAGQQSNFGTLPRTFQATAFDGSDRSQTSSVGAKGFASVNTMTGWPTVPSTGTPDRERQAFQAFGGSIFSPLGEMQSPGLGMGGGMFGAPGGSGLGRGGSKLGSLFPTAMQAQMHGPEQDSLGDSVPDVRQSNPLGAIGRGPVGAQHRDTSSPVRGGRGFLDDLFQPTPFTSGEQLQAGLTTTAQPQGQSFLPGVSAGPSFSTAPASADPSALRTMVMPDRMRWVYLDPQGTMQGPFNGLEMNDWYKANFFTPDLRVKRIEDQDFEPLGQLIRRIGNSREPFLVPQMGIPHGPPPQGGAYAIGGPADPVPPLQNAFPSFGRTLTAAQQNDLERRKQEEQLYHARQREMAHHHHQTFTRLPMQPGVPGSLQHHSSAHSLQSQPSFGSMTSPIGMPPQGPVGGIAPNASFFDGPTSMGQVPQQSGMGPAPDLFPSDLNLGERQMLANMQAAGGLMYSGPSAAGPAGDVPGQRSGLPSIDQLQKDNQGFSTRIKEFHELRAKHDAEEAAAAQGVLPDVVEEESFDTTPAPEPSGNVVAAAARHAVETVSEPAVAKKGSVQVQSELSLTERVRRTQADAAAAAAVVKPVQQAAPSGLPLPFPPPAQSSTIAAPTAQRPGSNLPTRYDDRSASGTPDTTSDGAALAPPPTAPWAPQPGTEAQKGPSLKEIQEMEAKKAAKREEQAAAARRLALEQEALALREKSAAVNPGLPSTSTWGTSSPVGVSAAGSPWKQPAVAKGAAAGPVSASATSKKTLADIQREEEVRKQKAREAAAAIQSTATLVSSMGKRYADLASKSSAPPGLSGSGAATPVPTSGWATVGPGGKAKIPTGPAAQIRTVSSSNVKTTAASPVAKTAPKQVNIGLRDAKAVAMEEFKKWLNRELSRGLVGGVDIDTFSMILLELPLDIELLREQVYQYSTTMDGTHFAEEFIRRKKLADKGIVEKEPVSVSASESKSGNGGWNEVAKKGSNPAPKEDSVPGYRVVQTKKGKGKK